MTLKQFISLYDREGSIVLLEGKREVSLDDKEKLTLLGKVIASLTAKIIFRSGNAPGADHFFSVGVASVDKKRLEVIIPYTGHRKDKEQAGYSFSLDDINLAAEPEVIYQSKRNKKTAGLINRFVTGERTSYSMKAAYIIRDTVKVLGAATIKPATFGIFYDNLDHPGEGGTGHTMSVCKANNIPYIDQRTWFQWLKD